MKLAVTYDNGEVFQHFGKTQYFKIYEIEESKILSTEVIDTNGTGHEALADFLAELGVAVVLCGGLGDGALNALTGAGITVLSGAQGNTDEIVEQFLSGELVSQGVNCDHHHEEEHSCGGCGGGCGGCGSGCGGCTTPTVSGENVGKICRVHYCGTYNDGTQFDSSYDRGEPLEFVCGMGMMIPGFDQAVANMKVGETVDVHLMPEEAYGMWDPSAVITVEIASLPGSEKLEVGQQVYMSNGMGQQFPVTVTAKDEKMISLDANHEMAGKELNFKIELVEVK